jgi:hypothetical protein
LLIGGADGDEEEKPKSMFIPMLTQATTAYEGTWLSNTDDAVRAIERIYAI